MDKIHCSIESLLAAVFDMASIGAERTKDCEGERLRFEAIQDLMDMAMMKGEDCAQGCIRCTQAHKEKT